MNKSDKKWGSGATGVTRVLSRLAVAVSLLIAVMLGDAAVAGQLDGAEASHACNPGAPTSTTCGMSTMSVDMNPATAPANTLSVVGTIQNCARIQDDDIQNFDEDAIDTVTVDITAQGVSSIKPMLAFYYKLLYSETSLTIQTQDQSGSMLNRNVGSQVFTAGDPIPDLNGNNQFIGGAVDSGTGVAESGDGYLDRLTISSDVGSAPGIYTLVLTPADSSHIDPSNVLYFPDGIKSGAIAINQPCDGASLDDDQDRVYDIDELNCGGDPLNGLTRPERTDGSFAGVSDDGDALVDEPLPAGSATFDCDGDGWRGDDENIVFSVAPITTSDQDPCGNNGWAAELAAGDNVLNIADLNSFLSPTRPTNDGHGNFNKFGHPVPDSDPNIARWDIDPNSIVNIGDLNALSPGVMAATSRPPMFGGQPAFFTDPDGPGPMSVGQCPWPL